MLRTGRHQNYHFNISLLMAVVVSFLFASCVGTIEDKNLDTTKAYKANKNPIKFAGIHDAVPISYNKVDLFFYPADGEADELTYLINYDGLPNPISVPATSLKPDRGLLKFTVKGLSINQSYTFTVQVKDNQDNRSVSNESRSARTFSNLTANFDGIATVRNLPGAAGLTGLKVEWPEAERQGSQFSPKEMDPIEYRITLVDSDQLSSADINDPSFTEPMRKVVSVPSTRAWQEINGLAPGTTYLVQVRAIHHGSTLYGSDVTYKLEQNTDFIEATTLSLGDDGIDIDASSFKVSRSNGSAGLSSFEGQWSDAEGAFDHYRLYYNLTQKASFSSAAMSSTCLGPAEASGDIYCKKLDFTTNKTTVSGLSALSEYEANLVVCVDTACTDNRVFMRRTVFTDPGVALFGGITDIFGPRDPNQLDSIYLQVSSPDITSGQINGLLVEVKERNASDGPSADSILNHPTEPEQNITDLKVSSFDYSSASEIEVSGIDIAASVPYCFSVFPFIYNADNEVEQKRGGQLEHCITPDLMVPSLDEFPGLNGSIFDPSGSQVDLTWQIPAGGLYDEIRVFIRHDGGTFDFSQAINGHEAYLEERLGPDAIGYTISHLPTGSYSFGVLTYYSGLSSASDAGAGYSEFNSNIEVVHVP